MDSVIMTAPGPGSSMRLRSRLRSAASTLCARPRRGPGGQRHPPPHHNVNLNNGNQPRLKPPHANTRTIAREVYNAWCGRLGDVTRIPSDSVQALFNDMQLYPSKNQVLEMLQSARQCGRRNSSQFLTFGEFCVFAGELRRGGGGGGGRRQHSTTPATPTPPPRGQCEVFLGGSCNPTTWRADQAIPALDKQGITYYNPQVSTWSPELMAAEHLAKESALVLLFVVDSQTRCVAGMLEVAALAARRRRLVLVVQAWARAQPIMGEALSAREHRDLTAGQAALLALVRAQGVTVHTSLATALQCTVNLLRPQPHNDNQHERKLADKLVKLRSVFDSLDSTQSGSLSLSDAGYAYYQLTGSSLRICDLQAIVAQQPRGADVRVSFEQFCSIVAEFTTTSTTSDTHTHEWAQHPTPSNNNTSYENGFHTGTQWDVYLGGSSGSWRQRVAEPLLQRAGVSHCSPALLDNEPPLQRMHASTVVLFAITRDTRCVTSMILAAHYIALRRNVVLCVQQLPHDDCTIGEEVISKQAIKDYNRARAYLSDLAKHENVPTFESVQEAVECAVGLVQAHRAAR